MRRVAGVALVLCVGVLTGCQRPSRLTVDQPFAPAAQQHLRLSSQCAYFTDSGGRRAILLEFPLPAPRDNIVGFHVYLDAPMETGEFAVQPDSPEGVRGFFIQDVGDLRGKTEFAEGWIDWTRPMLELGKLALDVELTDASGMHVSGRVFPKEDAEAVRAFARRYAGDVAALRPVATSQPESQPNATAPRGGATRP